MPETAYIQSIVRAFEVLSMVHQRDNLRLADIANYFEIKTPTAHNMLRTLVHAGALEKNIDGTYGLGALIYKLANGYSSDWLKYVSANLGSLTIKIPWATVILAQVEQDRVRARLRSSTDSEHKIIEPSNQAMGLYTSASGLAHLAFCSEDTRLALMDATAFYEHGERLWQSFRKLETFLKKSRKNGYVDLPFPEPFFRVAFPIYREGCFAGTIGCSVRGPKAEDEQIRQQVITALTQFLEIHTLVHQ